MFLMTAVAALVGGREQWNREAETQGARIASKIQRKLVESE